MSQKPNKENKRPSKNTSSAERKLVSPRRKPVETVDIEYQLRVKNVQEKILKIRDQMKITKNEISKKDQCIKTALEQQRKHLESLEHKIFTYAQEAPKRMQSVLMQAHVKEKEITDKFAEMVKDYNDVKAEIDLYRNREKDLLSKLEKSKQNLLKFNQEYMSLEEEYNKQEKSTGDQSGEEAHMKEISKLELLVKRLELQTKSLNSELTQKAEECKALSALYEDIGG